MEFNVIRCHQILSIRYVALKHILFVLYFTYWVLTVAMRHLFQKQKRRYINYLKIIARDASTLRMYHMHRIATKGGQF